MEENKSENVVKTQNNIIPVLAIGLIIIAILIGVNYLTKSNKSSSNIMSPSPSQTIMNKKENNETGKKGIGMEPLSTPTLTAEQMKQKKEGISAEITEKTFNIDGGNFYFAPGEIKVNKGDKVTIVFKNDGGSHNFILDEFNVESKLIKTGETDIVEFVADKVGTFEYYCSVGQHRKLGMKGTLTVQ